MSNLFVFGDSYSTPDFCVAPKDSWWGLLSQDLRHGIQQIHNYSWPGNNIDSIAHILMCIADSIGLDDYVVIGIPPLQRLTMFNPDKQKPCASVIYDCNLKEQDRSTVLCHQGLAQYNVHEMPKEYVLLWNPSWIEAQALRSLLLLDVFLKRITDRVIFVNLSVPLQPPTQWPVLSKLQQQTNKSNMLLFNDTYYSVNLEKNKPVDFDTHQWMGHHGPEGNHLWYHSAIKPMIQHLGWL